MQVAVLVSVKNNWFNNLKSRVDISKVPITVRAFLMRAYVVMYLPVVLAERFQNVISFGTIKEPTALIPTGILGRALEYDSGIKRRLYDYSSYDSLTGSLCGRQPRRRRESTTRMRWRRGREGGHKDKEEGDKMQQQQQPRRFCYLKVRWVHAHFLLSRMYTKYRPTHNCFIVPIASNTFIASNCSFSAIFPELDRLLR